MRKYLSFLLALLMVFTFAGCSNDVNVPSESEPAVSAEPSTPKPAEPEESKEPSSKPETEIDEPEAEASEPETPVTETPEELTVKPLSLLKTQNSLQEWNEDIETYLVRSEYSFVTLSEEDAKAYPELAESLNQLATMQARTMEYEYDDLLVGAKEQLDLAGVENFTGKLSKLNTIVRRADSVAVGLLEDTYLDTGAIDGFRGFNGITYDTVTGQKLELTDVVKYVNQDLAEAVIKELNSHVWNDEVAFRDAVETYFANVSVDSINWTLDYNGVTFYFADGDIEEQGYGCRSATVAFAEYPELFEEKYMAVPEAYAVELSMDSPYFTDLNGDGTLDEQTVTGLFSKNDMLYTEYAVYSAAEETYYYGDRVTEEFHPYYLQTAGSGHYLYLFSEQNDSPFPMMDLKVYDMSGGKVTDLGTKNMGPAYIPENTFRVPTDPGDLLLDDYDGAAQQYAVGTDGMPQLLE